MHINILLLSNENSGINAKPDKKQIYLVPGIWLPKPQETPHHDSSYDGGVSLGLCMCVFIWVVCVFVVCVFICLVCVYVVCVCLYVICGVCVMCVSVYLR